MMLKIFTYFVLVAYSQTAFAAQSTQPKTTMLYCTGQTRYMANSSDEVPTNTDAIIRLTQEGIYIEINLVGFGLSQGKLKMASSIAAVGDITLQSAVSGQPPMKEAWFNLNKYSGELIVVSSSTEGSKLLFKGNCKLAVPLF